MKNPERELLRQQMELLAKESETGACLTDPVQAAEQMVKIERELAFGWLFHLILLAALADLVVGFFVLLVKGFGI